MKLLLDTHIWLWSRLEPQRQSRRISSALSKSTNELWLSPVSMWEILALCRKGRLNLKPDPIQWIQTALAKVPVHDAPVTQEVALATRGISLRHNDPMDFLLAATAKVYDLTLVTADEHLISGSGFAVLANR
jgi:PIN domain nuclease of toxin-antitoxin system